MDSKNASPKRHLPTHWLRSGIAWAASLAVLGHCANMVFRIRTARALSGRIAPLQVEPLHSKVRLLMVGDSTAVGTGASQAGATLAGLIAK